jgi:hypothetical protein
MKVLADFHRGELLKAVPGLPVLASLFLMSGTIVLVMDHLRSVFIALTAGGAVCLFVVFRLGIER